MAADSADEPGNAEGGHRNDPLRAVDYEQLREAQRRFRPIRAAAKLATFHGWAFAVSAAVAAPLALLDPINGVVAVLLAAVAAAEFRGRHLLMRLEERGPALLGWNQLALLALTAGYCAWRMTAEAPGGAALDDPQLRRVVGDVRQLAESIRDLVYATILATAAIWFGLAAWFYFRRRRMLREHLARTPAWVIELQRTAEGG